MKENFTIHRQGLAQLPVFMAVARARSFTRGAQALAISASAASQAVLRLERELDATLLVRTTRSVNLTEAGARLYERARAGLEIVTEAFAATGARTREPAGRLRLNVPRLACHAALPPLLAAYTKRHPHVSIDVVVDDRNIDIVAAGFDAGIRLHEQVQKDMIAVRLTNAMRFAVVGAPGYFAAHGRPKRPRDLLAHACLAWRSPTTGEVWRWEFENRGRTLDVAISGPISSTDAELLLACARDGLGLTYTPLEAVAADLQAGRLESVLTRFAIEDSGLFLYYPRSAARVPKLAAFVALARELRAARH